MVMAHLIMSRFHHTPMCFASFQDALQVNFNDGTGHVDWADNATTSLLGPTLMWTPMMIMCPMSSLLIVYFVGSIGPTSSLMGHGAGHGGDNPGGNNGRRGGGGSVPATMLNFLGVYTP